MKSDALLVQSLTNSQELKQEVTSKTISKIEPPDLNETIPAYYTQQEIEQIKRSTALNEFKRQLQSTYKCSKFCLTENKVPAMDSRPALQKLNPAPGLHKNWGSNRHTGDYLAACKIFNQTYSLEEENQLLQEAENYVEKYWENFQNEIGGPANQGGKQRYEYLKHVLLREGERTFKYVYQ